jgi:hypothetical protein
MSALHEPDPTELDIEIALAEASNWQRTMIRGSELQRRPAPDWRFVVFGVSAVAVTLLWLLRRD